MPGPRWASPGDQLPVRARCHSHLLPALRGHFPLLLSTQALQEQPLLPCGGEHLSAPPVTWSPVPLAWGWLWVLLLEHPAKLSPSPCAGEEAGERFRRHPGHPRLLCCRCCPGPGDPQAPCPQRAEGASRVGRALSGCRAVPTTAGIPLCWPCPSHFWLQPCRGAGCSPANEKGLSTADPTAKINNLVQAWAMQITLEQEPQAQLCA